MPGPQQYGQRHRKGCSQPTAVGRERCSFCSYEGVGCICMQCVWQVRVSVIGVATGVVAALLGVVSQQGQVVVPKLALCSEWFDHVCCLC